MSKKTENIKRALYITKMIERNSPRKWGYVIEGRQTECFSGNDPLRFINKGADLWIGPWVLECEVNGFTLPLGNKWANADEFKQHDLPRGFRPLIVGESPVVGDDKFYPEIGWIPIRNLPDIGGNKYRTRRPFSSVVAQDPIAVNHAPVPDGYRELTDEEKKDQWIPGAKYNDLYFQKNEWRASGKKQDGAWANAYCRMPGRSSLLELSFPMPLFHWSRMTSKLVMSLWILTATVTSGLGSPPT